MKALAALGSLALILAVIAGSVALSAWIIMLLVGAVHGSLIAAVPAIGFWQSVVASVALSFVIAVVRQMRK